MNRLSRLSLGQRVVLVVGFAAMLLFIGDYATSAGTMTGWAGYAPMFSAPLLAPGGLPAWLRLLVWLALVVIWVGGSLPLMASRPGGSAAAPGGARAQDAPGSRA